MDFEMIKAYLDSAKKFGSYTLLELSNIIEIEYNLSKKEARENVQKWYDLNN